MGMKTNIRFGENEELLDIRYDHIFKAVFTQNTHVSKGALSDLISTLIGRKVSVDSIAANEPPIDDIRDRSIRFDISCKTENDELVNIEMSLKPDSCELVRLEYYAGKLFSRQNIRGTEKNYAGLRETYQIALLANRCFFDDEELVHTFEYHDRKHDVSLGGRSRIITVELKKADLVIEKPVLELAAHEAWAAFFQYLTDRSKRTKINEIVEREEGIAMASEVLINITQEDIEWARQLSEEKYILDNQSMRVTARLEGREEGRQEGREEGIVESRAAIARNLLEKGSAPEFVKEITGLDLEAIQKLLN